MKLEAENLTFSYGAKKILDNIGFSVAEGEFVSLLGPSGSGKSTVLKLLTGVLKGEKGKIRIDGREIRDPSGRFAYMPQNDLLFPWKTILDNVCLYGQIHGSLEAMRKEARGYLSEFGLAGYEDCYPSQLSGGMRQRAAFLRTALCQADILLLDEPFGALDVITRGEMQDWLLHLRRKFERTVILVTHDMDEAIYLSDRILILNQSPAGIVDEILIDAEVRDREWLYSQGQLRRKIYGRIMGRADAGSAQSRQGPEEEAHGVMQRKRNER
ncbi:MAG: ABC transporter ATP-binding protein [Hungatella sp.]|nr:ABC transporter ATP-binding protein [Hungatella sp.]